MASTITIEQSIQWAQAYGGFRPLTVGANSQPAISAANVILQTILGPPFAWNWNRATHSFLTTANIQDYAQNIADFWYIEKAAFIPAATVTQTELSSNVATYTADNNFQAGDLVTVTGTTNGGGVFNVTNEEILSATSTQFTVSITGSDVPSNSDSGTAVSGAAVELSSVQNVLGFGTETGPLNFIAPQIDNNGGQITFRVLPLPDGIYQVSIVYQKRPSLIDSISDTWSPVPDHYSYIYQPGFLALMMAYWNDPRWVIFNQKFVASLLSAAEGISQDQKNIWMETWLDMISEMQGRGLKTAQGIQGRGV